MRQAVARPNPNRPDGGDARDAFLARLLAAAAWAERNRRVAALGAVVLLALVAAGVYYVAYRRGLAEQAAARLQQVQVTALTEGSQAARDVLVTFLARYGDTPSADDARLLLARLELGRDSAQAAIRLLEPQARRSPGSPGGHAAAALLAAAYEQAERPEDALAVYERIATSARFPHQRREARAAVARLHAAGGRLAEAERIYAALAAEVAEANDPASEALYALRLGEIRARLAAGEGAGAAGAGGDPGVPEAAAPESAPTSGGASVDLPSGP